MEELIKEQTEAAPQTAEAEKESGGTKAEVSLGKFKDVNALLNAYNSLQSEFTKRSQRLKELEGSVVADKTTENSAVPTKAQAGNDALNNAESTTFNVVESRDEVLKDYLKSVVVGKQKAIVLEDEGVGVKTPVAKPKTIAEAGLLAKEIL